MTRKILDFVKSPTGKFLIFFLAVIIFGFLFKYYKNLPNEQQEDKSQYEDEVSIKREYERFRTEFEKLSGAGTKIKTALEKEVEKQDRKNDDLEKRLNELEKALAEEKARNVLLSLETKKPEKQEERKAEQFRLSPVSLFTAKPVKKAQLAKPLKNYAPFGRLLKCQLVNTIDSSNFDTPIIALVTEDLWHNGKVIIPAGTEIHGRAQSVTQRNRIATNGSWVLVWRTKSNDNGFELPLSGIALDYSRDLKSGRYQITDGSAGLRGFEVKTEEYSKLKLYASLFIKGASEGLSDLILEEAKKPQENIFINSSQNEKEDSSEENNQLKIGLAKGVEEAVDLYVKDMLDAISRDGVFIRVTAGTSFYLYITQTIDKSKAFPGAAGSNDHKEKAPEENEGSLQEAEKLMLSLAQKRLQDQIQQSESGEDQK